MCKQINKTERVRLCQPPPPPPASLKFYVWKYLSNLRYYPRYVNKRRSMLIFLIHLLGKCLSSYSIQYSIHITYAYYLVLLVLVTKNKYGSSFVNHNQSFNKLWMKRDVVPCPFKYLGFSNHKHRKWRSNIAKYLYLITCIV